jgi:hypothetical protein
MLLDGDKPPNRPKTTARTHTIPQKSYECFNVRPTRLARVGNSTLSRADPAAFLNSPPVAEAL